jgi:hypothetical protein
MRTGILLASKPAIIQTSHREVAPFQIIALNIGPFSKQPSPF